LSEFERRRNLQRAIEQLPDDQRIAVLLRLEQELSLEQIAMVTGGGRETVKSRLRYAMNRLREVLSE
jgi:RNA polymerase sigma-70 factor (ECF subfamily)